MARLSPGFWRARFGDLGTRSLTAAVLLPLVLLAVWSGGWVWQALLVAAASLMAMEWVALVDGQRRALPVLLLALACGALLGQFVVYGGAGLVLFSGIAALVLLVLGLFLCARFWTLGAGFLYIGAPMLAAAWLRSDAQGAWLIFFVLGAVVASDICALLAGRLLGGPKLWPRISPRKTWAGLGGGAAAAAAVGALVGYWLESAPLWRLALLGAALGLLAQAGDLLESWLKRRQGVEDSGALLPGHGGVLDRVDGLVFALLGMAALALWRGGLTMGPYAASFVWR